MPYNLFSLRPARTRLDLPQKLGILFCRPSAFVPPWIVQSLDVVLDVFDRPSRNDSG